MTCPCSASRRLAAQRRAKKSSRRSSTATRRRPKRRAGVKRRRAKQSATAYTTAGGLLPSGLMGARRLGVSSPYPGAAAPYATGSVGRLNYTPYP